MNDLAERLEQEGRTLSQRVLARMYRDPFWTERYGERGRRHADEDSDFHLRYLARALAADDAAVLRRYAAWLRDVLNARGMCTRHLDENFRLLSEEIAAQSWTGRERAVAFLGEARKALAWPAGDPAALQANGDAIAAAVVRAFRARRPAGWKRDARGEDALRDDAANYVSYVCDALAMGKPDTLAAHTRWLAAHVQAHGAGEDDVSLFLDSVRDALAAAGAGDAVLAFVPGAGAIA